MQTTGADVLQRLGRPPPLKVPSPVEESLIDELVMKVASPRTKDLLQDYTEQYRVRTSAHVYLAALGNSLRRIQTCLHALPVCPFCVNRSI